MTWTSIPYTAISSENNVIGEEHIDNNTIEEVGGFLVSNASNLNKKEASIRCPFCYAFL